MTITKVAFRTLSACLVLASLNSCTSGGGGGSTPAATSPATPNSAQTPADEPVLAGKVEVRMWDAQGNRLYSDKYENTKTEQVFKCFYDKRETFNAFLVTGYNPSSKSENIKRFFVTAAGNFVLKDGANEIRTTAGNSLISIDDKAAPADKPVYDQGFRYKAAMDGCKISMLKEGEVVKGELFCANISDSAFKEGFGMRVVFNCALTTLK